MGLILMNTIYGISLSLYLAAILPLFVVLIKRRDLQPIKAKGWGFTAVSTIGGAMMFTMICFRQPNPATFPCYIYILSVNLFFSLFFLPILFRVFRFIYIYYFSITSNDDSSGTKHRFEQSPILNNPCMITFYSFGVCFSIVVAILMILYIGRTGRGINIITQDHNITVEEQIDKLPPYIEKEVPVDISINGCEFGIEFVPFAIVAFGYVIAFLVFYYFLRKLEEDTFGVCKELKRCLLVWIPCTFMFFFCNLWQPMFWIDDYIPFSTWIIIMIVATNILSLLQPIMQTYSPYTGLVVSNLIQRAQTLNYETIGNIMNDVVARDAFQKWIIKHENDESKYYEFINDVRIYHMRDPSNRWKYSKQIKDNYLETGALNCVKDKVKKENMDIFNSSWIQCQIKSVAPTNIFEGIVQDINSYLQTKCVGDFIKSDEFKEVTKLCSFHHASLDGLAAHGLINDDVSKL